MKNLKVDLTNIKGDVFGGLTAGVVALPLALAFGDVTIGAMYGLYGAIVLGIVAAVFGGTPSQISGPTAPMTNITQGVIFAAAGFAFSPVVQHQFIVSCFILAGVFQIVFGLVKIGKYVKYIPYPVLSGFMSGIGVMIIIGQIFPTVGLSNPGTPLQVITSLNTINVINWISVVVVAATLAIIYLLPKVFKLVPSPLVALVGLTAIVYFAGFDGSDVPLIQFGTNQEVADANTIVVDEHIADDGLPEQTAEDIGEQIKEEQQTGGGFFDVGEEEGGKVTISEDDKKEEISFITIPNIANFTLNQWMQILGFAILLALLGTIDSLLTSLIADDVTKTRHNSNRELIGQGLGNSLSGFIGGLPGAGATIRTVVNVNSGGKTRISGVIHGIFLLSVLLGLGPLASLIPKAVLAGILITVGVGIIDYKGLRHLLQVPRSEAVILLIVLALTVFGNLVVAVGVGIVLSCVLFMKKISDMNDELTKISSIEDHEKELEWAKEHDLEETFKGQVKIKHINGPLFFGFSSQFKIRADELSDSKYVIMRMENVPYIDQSGAYALEEIIGRLEENGTIVLLCDVAIQPLKILRDLHVVPHSVKEEEVFKDFETCSKWVMEHMKTNKKEVEVSA